MTDEALHFFKKLLPEFPDVGGEKNYLSNLIPFAAAYAALYQPMKKNGRTAEETGKIMYDYVVQGCSGTSDKSASDLTEITFSSRALEGMEKWTEWTRKREYPSNWVCRFIRGGGDDFDFGIDYTECALVKYLTSLGVPELAPYVCVTDFPDSLYHNTGLEREKAIGYGDDICTFRYKKGRKVRQDWSTEIPLIRARLSRK